MTITDPLAEKLALARSMEERAQIFVQARQSQQGSLVRRAATQIAETGWGKDISQAARAAVAVYALETGTDPVRHWNVLGGKLYDNAELWIDLSASMEDYRGETHQYINDDVRLSDKERAKRRALRAEHNTPEDPKGICVVTIHTTRGDFVGVNWAGNRVGFNAKLKRDEHKKEGDLIQDPIGEQDPGKTSFTRAFRKAAKKAWPLWFARHPMNQDEDGRTISTLPSRDKVEALIEQGRQDLKDHPPEPSTASVTPQPNLAVEASKTGVALAEDVFADETEEDRRIREEEQREAEGR